MGRNRFLCRIGQGDRVEIPVEQLRMIRRHLLGLPDPVLPGRLELRRAKAEEADALAECLASAFPEFGWSAGRVIGELLGHPEVSATFVASFEDTIAATASCRSLPGQPQCGYLHWVAVHEDFRALGLGRSISAAALREFAAQGKSSAILDTDDHRIPAIKTYLKLGFEPEFLSAKHEERWQKVLAAITPLPR